MHSVLSAEIETESNAGFSPSLFSTEGGHSATHFMTIPAVEKPSIQVITESRREKQRCHVNTLAVNVVPA